MTFIDYALAKAREAQATSLPPHGWHEVLVRAARVQKSTKSQAIIVTAVFPGQSNSVDFRLMFDCETAVGLVVRDLEILLAISSALGVSSETPEGLCAAITSACVPIEVLVAHERDVAGQLRASLRAARAIRPMSSQISRDDALALGERP
ncbi:hypothetical protein [Microvirga arabica]|uniref:hypothetical protein n=1 Tax=Microvirga arabica TaxID=1128671 RepID=UPI00193AABA3|nr:hypothetical protein [Microvirga arabica]MBM1174372.1 hypothetical protein [Microvirga arabica]